jgi:outer membrane protein OmpA-like peptidoglycan-associated protein
VPKALQVPGLELRGDDCERRVTMAADTLFEFDKASLTAAAETTLGRVGPYLKEQGEHPLTIEGHTDWMGTDDYNQALSERRAESVRAWLATHDYLPGSTVTRGYGEQRPVAPNQMPDGSDDPEGRQKNRRVEIVVDSCH